MWGKKVPCPDCDADYIRSYLQLIEENDTLICHKCGYRQNLTIAVAKCCESTDTLSEERISLALKTLSEDSVRLSERVNRLEKIIAFQEKRREFISSHCEIDDDIQT